MLQRNKYEWSGFCFCLSAMSFWQNLKYYSSCKRSNMCHSCLGQLQAASWPKWLFQVDHWPANLVANWWPIGGQLANWPPIWAINLYYSINSKYCAKYVVRGKSTVANCWPNGDFQVANCNYPIPAVVVLERKWKGGRVWPVRLGPACDSEKSQVREFLESSIHSLSKEPNWHSQLKQSVEFVSK